MHQPGMDDTYLATTWKTSHRQNIVNKQLWKRGKKQILKHDQTLQRTLHIRIASSAHHDLPNEVQIIFNDTAHGSSTSIELSQRIELA